MGEPPNKIIVAYSWHMGAFDVLPSVTVQVMIKTSEQRYDSGQAADCKAVGHDRWECSARARWGGKSHHTLWRLGCPCGGKVCLSFMDGVGLKFSLPLFGFHIRQITW